MYKLFSILKIHSLYVNHENEFVVKQKRYDTKNAVFAEIEDQNKNEDSCNTDDNVSRIVIKTQLLHIQVVFKVYK